MASFSHCIICNAPQLLAMPAYAHSYLVRCKACNFVFCSEIPTTQTLSDFYSRYPVSNSLSQLTAKRYDEWLDSFEPFRKLNTILDVGCGDGYLLERAILKGWKVFGTEYTDRQVKQGIAKGINMHQGALDISNYAVNSFDVICSIEVIEHINNPMEELSKFNYLLRQGGAVYVTTPNFNALSHDYFKAQWNIITYPEHLCYFTKSTLINAFLRNGFKCSRFITTGISVKRYKQSVRNDRSIARSTDEQVRNKVEEKWYLRIVKNSINSLLTLFSKGDTLKGLFIKQ
ncbi:MAG: class I SAM-dependent methyltransferase [Bacteroidia bacterium]|nr:class I SAM-dependent methyltransferase [Bacteroidia bacterium]HQU99757.1 class I SAM-dependent methyltransferase [Bacteroidia bacterium]